MYAHDSILLSGSAGSVDKPVVKSPADTTKTSDVDSDSIVEDSVNSEDTVTNDVDLELSSPVMNSTTVYEDDIIQAEEIQPIDQVNEDEDEDTEDPDDEEDIMCEYTDDDLDEALKSDNEAAQTAAIGIRYELAELPTGCDANENPYMLMTPRKTMLSQSENNIHLQSSLVMVATPTLTTITSASHNATSAAATSSSVSTLLEPRDDSTYVEMFINSNNGKPTTDPNANTSNATDTLLGADDYKSNYEFVSFGVPSKIKGHHKRTESEPVYMELSQLRLNNSSTAGSPTSASHIVKALEQQPRHADGRSTIRKSLLKSKQSTSNSDVAAGSKKRTGGAKKHFNLPDIVKPSATKVAKSKRTPSDASSDDDADDESTAIADAPSAAQRPESQRSRSRFSLSDTFRPASYYLGASPRSATGGQSTGSLRISFDLADDSDSSEVVSPPPIPCTPPLPQVLHQQPTPAPDHYDTVKRRSAEKPPTPMGSDSRGLVHSYEQLPIPMLHSSSSSLNSVKRDAAAGLKASRLSLPDQIAKLQQLQQQQPTRAGPEAISDYSRGYMLSPSSSVSAHHQHPHHHNLQHPKQHSESSYSYHTDNSSIASSDYDMYNRVVASQLDAGSIASAVELRSPTPAAAHAAAAAHDLRQLKRRPLSEDSLSEIAEMGLTFEENIATHRPDLDVYLQKLENTALYQNTIDTGSAVPFIRPPEVFRGDADEDGAFYGNIRFQKDDQCAGSSAPATTAAQFHVGEMVTAPTASVDASASATIFYDSLEENKIASNASTPVAVETTSTAPPPPIHPHSRMSSQLSDTETFFYAELGTTPPPTPLQVLTAPAPPHKLLNNLRDVAVQKRAANIGIALIQNPIARENLVGSLALHNETKDRHIENKNLFGLAAAATATAATHTSAAASADKNIERCGVGYAANKLYGVKPINTNTAALVPQTSGDVHWEEDDMWRESLRRVSHRHARSLDALDRIDAPTTKAPLRRPTKPTGLANRQQRPFGPLPPVPPPASDGAGPDTEDDVYVQLLDGQHYQADMYERLKQENVPNSRKSIEINRDLIRQWDSMSSGLTTTASFAGGGAGGVVGVGGRVCVGGRSAGGTAGELGVGNCGGVSGVNVGAGGTVDRAHRQHGGGRASMGASAAGLERATNVACGGSRVTDSEHNATQMMRQMRETRR